MKILLVEDNQDKINKIGAFLKEEFNDYYIEIKTSYQSALKEIMSNHSKYSLILLDISLPTYDVAPDEPGGEPMPLAGEGILKEMYYADIMTNVIVVTMYVNFVDKTKIEDLDKRFIEEYSDNYKGYVYFASNQNSWKEKLKNKINALI